MRFADQHLQSQGWFMSHPKDLILKYLVNTERVPNYFLIAVSTIRSISKPIPLRVIGLSISPFNPAAILWIKERRNGTWTKGSGLRLNSFVRRNARNSFFRSFVKKRVLIRLVLVISTFG